MRFILRPLFCIFISLFSINSYSADQLIDEGEVNSKMYPSSGIDLVQIEAQPFNLEYNAYIYFDASIHWKIISCEGFQFVTIELIDTPIHLKYVQIDEDQYYPDHPVFENVDVLWEDLNPFRDITAQLYHGELEIGLARGGSFYDKGVDCSGSRIGAGAIYKYKKSNDLDVDIDLKNLTIKNIKGRVKSRAFGSALRKVYNKTFLERISEKKPK